MATMPASEPVSIWCAKSPEGRLIGTYRMHRGTGLDLWYRQREDGSIYLGEVHHLLEGRRHGFEWWINEDQETVYIERHWREGQLHGIWREWNAAGRLRRVICQPLGRGTRPRAFCFGMVMRWSPG